jgi:hypothetical protein
MTSTTCCSFGPRECCLADRLARTPGLLRPGWSAGMLPQTLMSRRQNSATGSEFVTGRRPISIAPCIGARLQAEWLGFSRSKHRIGAKTNAPPIRAPISSLTSTVRVNGWTCARCLVCPGALTKSDYARFDRWSPSVNGVFQQPSSKDAANSLAFIHRQNKSPGGLDAAHGESRPFFAILWDV